MKKGIVIGLLMFFVLATVCFAEEVTDVVYAYTITNNAGGLLDTTIPVYAIRPLVDKLVGYDCMSLAPTGEHTETYISIFDAITSTMTGECFGEQEASNGPESIGDRWPRGRKIFNGVAVRQGAYTEVQIYFRRK